MYTIVRKHAQYNNTSENKQLSLTYNSYYRGRRTRRTQLQGVQDHDFWINKSLHDKIMTMKPQSKPTSYQFQVIRTLFRSGYFEGIYEESPLDIITDYLFKFEKITDELQMEIYNNLKSKLPDDLAFIVHGLIDQDYTERDIEFDQETDRNMELLWEDIYWVLNKNFLPIHDHSHYEQYWDRNTLIKTPFTNGQSARKCKCKQCYIMLNINKFKNAPKQLAAFHNELQDVPEKRMFYTYSDKRIKFWISEYGQNKPYYDEILYPYDCEKIRTQNEAHPTIATIYFDKEDTIVDDIKQPMKTTNKTTTSGFKYEPCDYHTSNTQDSWIKVCNGSPCSYHLINIYD